MGIGKSLFVKCSKGCSHEKICILHLAAILKMDTCDFNSELFYNEVEVL